MAAMSNTMTISGNVFAVNEKGVIRYTEQHRDGSYTLEQINSRGVKIFEIENEWDHPRIEHQQCALNASTPEELKDLQSIPETSQLCGTRIAIYVPKDSVSSDFNVDPSN